ncbi:MAG: hypothetical protein HY316_01685 [Acidobacteria bacterium]|nr:hypothetical protein [Acidobacteriota bacterium]
MAGVFERLGTDGKMRHALWLNNCTPGHRTFRQMTVNPHSRAKQALILATMILFSLPMGRFYLVLEPGLIECLEHLDSHHALMQGGHTHEDATAHSQSHDDGYYFQHCKDNYASMGLTALPPFGMPVQIGFHFETPFPATPRAERVSVAEGYSPIPFHPPRHRA